MKKNQSIHYLFIIFIMLLGNGIASAQKIFKAFPANATMAETNALKKVFKRQTIIQLDAHALHDYIKQAGAKSNIIIDGGNLFYWNIYLEEHDLRSPDYIQQSSTSKGLVTLPREDCFTYAGYLKGSSSNYVRMNIHENKLSGNIIDNGRSVYIEPLKKFFSDAPADKYVLYKRGDCLPVYGYCSASSPAGSQANEQLTALAAPQAADCRKIEIATESDWENYNQGITSADIVGNLNFVEPLYQVIYGASIIVKYQHEWATSADPYTQTLACGGQTSRLSEFKSYWQTNYTWVKRDINILYSGVDFDGSTIGCAYVGVFGSSTSDACYAVSQWIKSYSDEQREVLVAHEMGHIFGAEHDADALCSSNDGPIMCPTINSSCTDKCTPYWSTASFNSISAGMSSSSGSYRLRTREFNQYINTSIFLGISPSFSGNDLYVQAENAVGTGFLGNGTITYTGTDNITMQPGAQAYVLSGTGSFNLKIGACDINGQLAPDNKNQIAEADAARTVYAGNITGTNASVKVYPNPFSSVTNLGAELMTTAHVSLSVYDINGKLIEMPIINKLMPAGSNTFMYNGSRLKAGTYLFIIDVDEKRFTEKVIKL